MSKDAGEQARMGHPTERCSGYVDTIGRGSSMLADAFRECAKHGYPQTAKLVRDLHAQISEVLAALKKLRPRREAGEVRRT